jgi:hypothetical protein
MPDTTGGKKKKGKKPISRSPHSLNKRIEGREGKRK